MSPTELSRVEGRIRPAAPVRLVHLGLGNFFRAHQAWYTDRAPDAPEWGIAAFSGRGGALARALAAQEGLYTLVTRAAEGDHFDVIASVSRAHAADDHRAWLAYFADRRVQAVTITVTEAGYIRGPSGGLDRDRAEVQADVNSLRHDRRALVRTAPARLAAALEARRQADAGPLTIVPCDNLFGNGAIAARVVRDLAELVFPELLPWMEQSVSTVTTMVDRITPRTDPEDERLVTATTGVADRCPVVTEPFSEWVLGGTFAADRPAWERAGATFAGDIEPHEQRKLWLLNGGHSLLAYTGLARGHATIAGAVADDACRTWLERWWTEASAHLTLPAQDLAAYRSALLQRFANPRMHHQLHQIATDGSQKLPVRILPVLRRERAAGRVPEGAALVIAGWIDYLRDPDAEVSDVRARDVVPLVRGALPDAVRRVLRFLNPALAEDAELATSVRTQAETLLQARRVAMREGKADD